jgi:hypothetical protein
VTITTLDPGQETDVRAALSALELARDPVSPQSFKALCEPSLRAQVASRLQESGRVLLTAEGGFISGYDDSIADRLVEQGMGVLEAGDRAVLALVLLLTVAIPRAKGRISGSDWTEAEPTSIHELALNRHLPKHAIRTSVRRLRAAGILRPGHRAPIAPGPQFLRLTQRRGAQLWEELVLLCKPDGTMADVIRRRRRRTKQLGSEP